ncbi:cholinesterase 1-like [Neocloeon triangulifer]|uniref:cholinesterase 1-like n=1 Tax=Neocloeon triangulifer TaxID=2078957 RepID=UPI00286EC188|nr:cholinesterase 1-like [Neocloeon triangulifer]
MAARLHVLILVLAAAAAASAAQVNIPGLGSVEGTTSTTAWSQRTVYEYRGIPYAKPPSGVNRFKAPVKMDAWIGVLDATQFGQACPQPSWSRLGPLASFMTPDPDALYQQSRAAALATDPEDCLTLDVYTPTTEPGAKLPVLVYIHGGFWLWGSSAVNRPGYLLQHDLILVSIQYRLGPLGFTYLDDAEAPGNAGLMDQVMALEWVRDNIAAFGGDPAKVTVGGFSAGAASASLLMLSPAADGLFHRVVSQSGSALGLWAVDETVGVKDSEAVAALAGCAAAAPAQVAECLRAKSPDALILAYLQYAAEQRKNGQMGTGGAMPVIQNPAGEYPKVLVESPRVTLANDTYEARPLLAGVNKHEGIFVLDYAYETFLVPNGLLEDEDFLKNQFVTVILNAYHVKENSQTFVDAVTRRYLNQADLGDFTKMTEGLVDMLGSEFIKSPWYRQADLLSLRGVDVFLYAWDFYGTFSLLQTSNVSVPVVGGITHGDDTIYLFPKSEFQLSTYETDIAKRFVAAYTNFIINGDPTPSGAASREAPALPKWETFTRDASNFMSFRHEATLKKDFRKTFTVARDEQIRGAAAATLASPLLLAALALLYTLLQ